MAILEIFGLILASSIMALISGAAIIGLMTLIRAFIRS